MATKIETVAGAQAKANTAVATAAAAAKALYLPRPEGPVKLFDIGDYLGSTLLPAINDGVGDAYDVIRAAYWAAYDWHVATGGIAAIYVPEGKYRMRAAIGSRTGVGIVGAGRDLTYFYPVSNNSFTDGPLWSAEPEGGWTFYDDQLFADFTIDCILQSASVGYGATKGFYYQNARRIRYERVAILNSWATSFGVDFIIDGRATDCYAYNAGRGSAPDEVDNIGPTNSGFAPGTGRFEDESMIWNNCVAEGCFGAGWLFEQVKSRAAFDRPVGYSMVNCRSTRNKFGVSDLGLGGLKITGCELAYNTHSGLYVDCVQERDPSRYGTITATNFYRNGGATGSPLPEGNGVTSSRGNTPIGYTFAACTFEENDVAGIYLHNSTTGRDAGGLHLTGCTFTGSDYGLCGPSNTVALRALSIQDDLSATTPSPTSASTRPWSHPSSWATTFDGTTPVGIAGPTGKTVTKPVVTGNVFARATAMTGTPADNTLIKDNAILV